MMPKGYNNKIVRVDLTTQKIGYDQFDEEILKRYIGGSGLAAKIIWNETTPDNALTAGTHTISVNLSGEAIQSMGIDGPYKAWIGLFQVGGWDSLDSLDHTTNTYTASEFATPSIRFNTSAGISPYKFGTEGNYQYLQVNL